MHGPSHAQQLAVSILEDGGAAAAGDPGWAEVSSVVRDATFYQYDYDVRTFEQLGEGCVAVRGAILGRYPIEVMPGLMDDMSFAIPARFEIDLDGGTVRSHPQIDEKYSRRDAA